MEHYTPLDKIPYRGERVCLLKPSHSPHDWFSTSEGGGHMVYIEYVEHSRDPAKWTCPGVYNSADMPETYHG
jgi:hypothetical protein